MGKKWNGQGPNNWTDSPKGSGVDHSNDTYGDDHEHYKDRDPYETGRVDKESSTKKKGDYRVWR